MISYVPQRFWFTTDDAGVTHPVIGSYKVTQDAFIYARWLAYTTMATEHAKEELRFSRAAPESPEFPVRLREFKTVFKVLDSLWEQDQPDGLVYARAAKGPQQLHRLIRDDYVFVDEAYIPTDYKESYKVPECFNCAVEDWAL